MNQDMESGKVGTSFENFLKEEGTLGESSARAVKRVLAFQLTEDMKALSLIHI